MPDTQLNTAAKHFAEGEAALQLLDLHNPLRTVLGQAVGEMRNAAVMVSITRDFRCGQVVLTGQTDLDSAVHLFDYYADELTIDNEELIGRTRRQCLDVFMRKDAAYLQS